MVRNGRVNGWCVCSLNVFDADGVLGARGLLMGRTAGQASRGHLERGRWEGRCGRRPGREEGLA